VKAGSEKKADRYTVALEFRRKTPMLCRWPLIHTQPNSRCSASNVRARSWYLALDFFRLEPGPLPGSHRPDLSPTRPVWRFHVPL